MPIALQCQCGKRISAPDPLAGKKAKCSTCGAILSIPTGKPTNTKSPVRCQSCGAAFAADDRLAGKRVNCPACGGSIDIPTAVASVPTPSPHMMADDVAFADIGSLDIGPQPQSPGMHNSTVSPGVPAEGKATGLRVTLTCPKCRSQFQRLHTKRMFYFLVAGFPFLAIINGSISFLKSGEYAHDPSYGGFFRMLTVGWIVLGVGGSLALFATASLLRKKKWWAKCPKCKNLVAI